MLLKQAGPGRVLCSPQQGAELSGAAAAPVQDVIQDFPFGAR